VQLGYEQPSITALQQCSVLFLLLFRSDDWPDFVSIDQQRRGFIGPNEFAIAVSDLLHTRLDVLNAQLAKTRHRDVALKHASTSATTQVFF